MENQEFQLGAYLTNGVEKIVKGAVRATLTDPKESAFMARFVFSGKEASRKRAKAEESGESLMRRDVIEAAGNTRISCSLFLLTVLF